MARIDDLLREADLIIEKKASKNTEVKPAVSVVGDDEVTKLANLLMENDSETFTSKVANETVKEVEEVNFVEKVAEAIVLAEVVKNIDKFTKIAQFEKQAQEAGYSQHEIDKFIVEKML